MRARNAAQERFQTGAAPRLEALQSQLALAVAQNEAAAAQGELVEPGRAECPARVPARAAPTFRIRSRPVPRQRCRKRHNLALSGMPSCRSCKSRSTRARPRRAGQSIRSPIQASRHNFAYSSPPDFTYGWRLGAAIAIPILTTGRAEWQSPKRTSIERSPIATHGRPRSPARRLRRRSGLVGTASVLRYQNGSFPPHCRWRQNGGRILSRRGRRFPALIQMIQAARQVRLNALQAGLDYQVALADLERAIGTALK